MPHIIVKHTHDAAIEMPRLLRALHESLGSQDTINVAQIKTYAEPLPYCIVSDDTQEDRMIHIQVRMKPGRPDDLRLKCSQDLHAIAQTQCEEQNYKCSISVEIHELDAVTYISTHPNPR